MSCPNLSIPSIKMAVENFGYTEVANILDNNFPPDYLPTYEEISSYVMPDKMREIYNKESSKTIKSISKALARKHNLRLKFDHNISVLGKTTPDGSVIINPDIATKDTPFHEFSHPLVNMLAEVNPIAYESLKRAANKNEKMKQMVEKLYPDYTPLGKERELMAQFLGVEAAEGFQEKSILRKIWDYLMNLVADVMGFGHIDITTATTVGDLVNIMVGRGKLDLSEYTTEEYQRSSDFDAKYVNATDRQREELDKLRTIIEADFKVNEKDGGKYESLKFPGKKLDRTTEVIQRNSKYAFEDTESTDESQNTISIEWGNIVDRAAEMAFNGEDIEDILADPGLYDKSSKVSEEAIRKVVERVQQYMAERPDSIFLTQITPYNISKNIAGSSDILEIRADGTKAIIDVKTSKRSTVGEHQFTSKSGFPYTWSYDTGFRNKKSLKKKHEAQVSLYSGLYKSKGVDIQDLIIMPFYFNEVEENMVKDVTPEPLYTTEDGSLTESYEHTKMGMNDETVAEEDQIFDTEDKEARTLHDKVLILLEQEKNYLENQGGRFSQARISRLTKIQEDIKTAKSVVALEKVIDSLFEMFVSYKGKSGNVFDSNFRKEVKNTLNNIRNGKISDDFEVLRHLTAIKERISLYKETIYGLKRFFNEHMKSMPHFLEEGSSLDKAGKILDSFEETEYQISKMLTPAIVKILAKYENKDVAKNVDKKIAQYDAQMKRDLKRFEESVNKRKPKDPAALNAWEVDRKKGISKIKANYTAKIENLTSALGDEQNLADLLSDGYKGISLIEALFINVSEFSNPLSAAFDKALRRELNKVRDKMQRWGMRSHGIIKKFDKKSGIIEHSGKVNDKLITEVSGKLFLISELDYDKFFKARDKAYAEIDADENLSYIEKLNLKNRWDMANTDVVPMEDITMTDPYNGETLVLRKGVNTILREKQQSFIEEYGSPTSKYYQEAYEEWLNSVSILDPTTGERIFTGYEFRIPSKSLYENASFNSVYAENSEYYDAILASYIRAYNNYGMVKSPLSVYRIPAVPKGLTDRIMENGVLNALKHFRDSNFRHMASLEHEEAEIYGSDALGTHKKTIPMLYYNTKVDPENISKDLLAASGIFLQASETYKAQKKLEPLATGLLESMKGVGELNVTADGRKKIFKRAEDLGISLEKYEKKWGNNYLAMALESLIDAEIYGIRQKKETFTMFGKEVNGGKIANFVMGAMSMTSIAAKPLVAIANGLQQNAMLLLEAGAKEFVSPKSWAKAVKDYEKYEISGSFTKDMVSGYPESFIGQLIQLYDPYMGTADDHIGRRMSQKGFKRLMQSNTLYYMMHKADHQIYVTAMLALMEETMITNKNTGESVPLIQAYELVDGVLELKEGFDLGDSRIDMEFKEKMDSMNHKLHGIYDRISKPMAQRFATGRLVLMFRHFIPTGLRKRWKKEGVDHNTGTITEGFYRTFFRLAIRELSSLVKFGTLSGHNLSTEERANLMRFTVEAGLILLLSVAIMIMSKYFDTDDEEEKRLWGYPMYLTYRLRSELFFYLNWNDMSRILKNPTVTYTQIERITRFVSQLMDPMEEMTTGHSIWEAGDNKALMRFWRLLGINGYTTRPDEAYKTLKHFTENQ